MIRPRLRILLGIFVVLVPLALAGDYLLSNFILLPSFLSLEKRDAAKCIAQCVNAIERESHHLEKMAIDWAYWDDTYQFVLDRNQDYLKANFQWPSLHDSGIDLILICDLEGKVIWRGINHPEQRKEIDIKELSLDQFPVDHFLLRPNSFLSSISGIILSEHGPWLLSSCPILTSENKGPPRGTLLMGRFLGDGLIRELSGLSHVGFEVKNPRTSKLSEEESSILSSLTPANFKIQRDNSEKLTVYGVIPDFQENPGLLVSHQHKREVYQCGLVTSRVVSLVIMGALIFVGLWLFIWLAISYARTNRRQAAIEEIVTQRTAALRESKERFRALADNIPGAIYLCRNDEFYTMIYLNEAAEEITGYPREDFIQEKISFVDLYHPDDVKKIRQEVDRCVKKHQPFHLIYRIYHRDGRCRWMEEHGVGVFDQGKLRFLEGFITDITDRRKVEQDRERLIFAIEQAAETFVITDPDAVIQYVNPAFEVCTGYAFKEVLGKNLQILHSGQQDNDFYRRMWKRLRKGLPWVGRLVNKRKDGSFYTEEMTISPVLDNKGAIINYVLVGHDVTNEIRLEQSLRQAQRMEAVGQLAGGVAHDFNNIMQVILGYTNMALEEIPPELIIHEYISDVREAAQRAAALTQQLLTFSRRQTIHPSDIDINDLIGNLLNLIRRLIGEHIDLGFSPGPGLGNVYADRVQLEQMLMNLCVNARDAMPSGGRLTIKTDDVDLDEEYIAAHPGSEIGRYVVICVNDTGCGIEQEEVDQIFDPFFTTKEVGKGTGLGLATVYGIVKRHQGYIQVNSVVGAGTTFNIYLPVVERHASRAPVDSEDTSPEGNETILIAEDDQMVLALAQHLLEENGYVVLTARNGQEAVNIFKEHIEEIDLVIFDVVMPKMGGEEALKQILVLRPDLPYLFVSGYAASDVHADFLRREGRSLLAKPYGRETLLSRVREILDKG